MRTKLLNALWQVTIWMLLLIFFAIPVNHFFSRIFAPEQFDNCTQRLFYLFSR